MKWNEIVGVTMNASVLAIFYTALGGMISYLLEFFVDEHTEEWEQKPTWYQVGDVSLQLAVIGVLAFWVTYIIREAAPIFPVSKQLDELIDTYISGVFFTYAMFLFIGFLDSKIKFLYHKFLDRHIEKMFRSRKTDRKKSM